MTAQRTRWRRAINRVMFLFTVGCGVVVLIPLGLILGYLVVKGASALNWDFFTQLPKPVGEPGGGMANALMGTGILLGLASAVGLPIGILGGIYLSEFGQNRVGSAVRFLADVLTGVPSIVMGIFAYLVVVLPMKGFSAYAGGFALGVMMIPYILRTTEELLKLVPTAIREAALALGVSHWRVILRVVLRTARGGIVTGVMVALARIAGETAPLLFTALGNRFWPQGLDQPIAAMPLQIFAYAISPFDDWHRQAWAGALVLIGMVLVISLVARLATKGRYRPVT